MPKQSKLLRKLSRTTNGNSKPSPTTKFSLDADDVEVILKFYYNSGYVSYEFGQDMMELKNRLEKWGRDNGIEESSWADYYQRRRKNEEARAVPILPERR
jgi:hypothetical protein